MPDGTRPEPGGWNRFSLEVADLAAAVEELRKAGVRFRNDIVTGVRGKQILLDAPAATQSSYSNRPDQRPHWQIQTLTLASRRTLKRARTRLTRPDSGVQRPRAQPLEQVAL
jgi:hypothetical protein